MSETIKKRSFAIGYTLVIHSLLMYWLQGGITTTGLNVFLPHFTGTYGWERTTLLNLLTVAALCAVAAAIFFAQMVKKFGPRKVTVLSLILGGILIICFGRVSSIATIITTCCLFCLAQGWGNVTTNTLMANWYPRKKAVILGITTIGLPLSDIVFVPVMKNLVGSEGFHIAYLFLGVFMIVLGIVSVFWVKDNPEDLGLAPDNDKLSSEQLQVATQRLRNFKPHWTLKRLLRDPNAWLLSIGFGLIFMCNKGMLSQMSFYFMAKNYTYDEAIGLMAKLAILGIFGSYIWGWIDDKIGTKKASIFYCIFYGGAFALMFLSGGPIMWVGIVLFEFCQGGIGNLIPSMMVTCYGRYEFPGVNRLLNPIVSLIYAFASFAVGFATTLTGDTGRAPIVFAVLVFIALILILFLKPHPRTDIIYDENSSAETAS